jgi:hypothetical protein
MSDPNTPLSAEEHRRLGVDLFNHVWTLLELAERTPEQVDEMIHAAHASRYHWSMSGPAAEPSARAWWPRRSPIRTTVRSSRTTSRHCPSSLRRDLSAGARMRPRRA